MSDTKNMSEIQRYGYTGEDEFKSWASKANFPATKVEHDFGFDFLCQVVGEPTPGKKSYSMTGHVFMVSVRSTTESGDLIKLNRADADLLLTNKHCVLAIVKRAQIDAAGKVAIKFVDKDFIKELHAFLRSGEEDLGVRFSKACSELTAIRYNVDRMFKSDYQNRLDHLKKTLKLEEVLKSPSLRIVQDGKGAHSVIRCSNVFDQFDVSKSDCYIQLQEAAFGREDQLFKRLKEIPLHPTILEVAQDLPSPMILEGRLTANVGSAELEVTGAGKTVRIEVETRVVGDWVGFVHPSGLDIRLSCAVDVDEQHVHHVVVGCDPETTVGELSGGVVAEFLAVCREDDARVSVVGDEIHFAGKEIEAFRDLGNLVACYQLIPDWPFIKEEAWSIGKITAEDFLSIVFLGTISRNANLVSGFGVAVGDEPVENLVELPREADLPICMNLRGHGVICWVTAKVNLLVEPSNVFVGLNIIETADVRFEYQEDTFLTGGEPLLKLSSGWGGIPLMHNKMRFCGDEDWGVQMIVHDIDDGGDDGSGETTLSG